MLRIILLAIASAFAVIVLKILVKSIFGQSSKNNIGNNQKGRANKQLVVCSVCNLYLPEKEAIKGNNKWFCSVAHRDKSV